MIIRFFEGVNKVAKFILESVFMFLLWPILLCEYLYWEVEQRIYSNEDVGSEQMENAKYGAGILFFIIGFVIQTMYFIFLMLVIFRITGYV